MKILVTGGAGFIGSNVVDRYVAEGHDLVVVDNLSTGSRENVNPRAKFFEVDVRDTEGLDKVFRDEKPDVVNHHAAQVDVSKAVSDPVYDAACNILGSINVIMASLSVGVKKLIYSSTGGAVYGEPEYLPVDESHPINPISPYGASKHAVEHYLRLFHRNDGLGYTILRYPNVFGPRQSPKGEAGVVAIFARLMLCGKRPTIYGDGGKTRDYVYVDDIADANVTVLEKGDLEIYNLGSEIETSDKEVFDAIAAAAGYKEEPAYAPDRIGDIAHSCVRADKAKQELGWRCKTPFAEGIQRTVEYCREHMGASKS